MKFKRVIFRLIINKVFPVTRFFRLKAFLLRLSGIKIGDSKVVGPILFGNEIIVSVGDNCWLGKNLRLDGNGEVEIGNNVDIGPFVTISTGGHEIGDSKRRAGEGIVHNIKIGDGTWIGTNVTIVNSITIGKGCIIAAGSVVNRDIPDNVMVAGVPAVVKKELGE